jgi:hypothetical protein
MSAKMGKYDLLPICLQLHFHPIAKLLALAAGMGWSGLICFVA